MKKLYLHIILFLVPIVLVLLLLPLNTQKKYSGLKDDCFNHGVWVHDRIHNNAKEADVIFLGSSHSINGINDELIESKLNNEFTVANFGYCRLGMNLYYTLLKDILKTKNPRHLILEVREEEDRYSHPIFPYLASSKEVLNASLLFNRDYPADVLAHFSYKLELNQDAIFNKQKAIEIQDSDFGFTSSLDTANRGYLAEIKVKRSQVKKPLSKFESNFHMRYPMSYLKKISHLCKQHQIELSFLYLPSYGSPQEVPLEIQRYSKYGEVLILPKSIFENPDYWHDKNHLNQAGAEAVSSSVGLLISNF